MFTILCCADVCREKVNLEVRLSRSPQHVSDVLREVQDVFSEEMATMSAARRHDRLTTTRDANRFIIHRMVIYNDYGNQWEPLESLAQLHELDQLYAFQPPDACVEVQQDLPPPRLPVLYQRQPSSSPPRRNYTITNNNNNVSGMSQPRYNDVVDRPVGSQSTEAKLQQQHDEEAGLLERLASLRNERNALEKVAAVEAEEDIRRRVAHTDQRIHDKEEELWRQRAVLRQAEEDFDALLAEKKRLVAQASALRTSFAPRAA